MSTGRSIHAKLTIAHLQGKQFDARSAEQAKAKLGLVARRIANGHGATVHPCFAAQAAALDAQT